MSKKWYSLFVSLEPSQPETAETASVRSAAQTVADLAASLAPPQPVESVPPTLAQTAVTGSFSEIYDAAGIQPPAHGYGILKVAEMLQSEHIRSLPREVKRSSILLALESSGASLQEVIQDAVQRDRALDTFERVQEQALGALDTAKSKENKDIQAELDRITAEYRARMQANTDEVARERTFLRLAPQKAGRGTKNRRGRILFRDRKSDHDPPGAAGRQTGPGRGGSAFGILTRSGYEGR